MLLGAGGGAHNFLHLHLLLICGAFYRFLVITSKGTYMHQPLVSIRPTRLEDWFSRGGGDRYTQSVPSVRTQNLFFFGGYEGPN